MQKKNLDIAQAFATLGISPHAAPDQIRGAYRRLVKRWHPDRFAQHPAERARAENTLKAINQAYAVIKNYLKTHPAEAAANHAAKGGPQPPQSDLTQRFRAAFYHPGGLNTPPQPRIKPRGASQQRPAAGFQEALKAAGGHPKVFKQPSPPPLRSSMPPRRIRPIPKRGHRSLRIEPAEPVSAIRPVAPVDRISD